MRLPYIILVMIIALSAMLSAQDKTERRAKIEQAFTKQYDANGNGTLDEDEKAVILKKYDADKNGKLDRPELKKAIQDLKGGAAGGDANNTGAANWSGKAFVRGNILGGGEKAVPENKKFRVFVLMGQSNMAGAGRAKELEAPYNLKHERIRIWANGRWEYLVPRSTFGPEVSFAHEMSKHFPNDTIGIIKIAIGGTSIRAWEKNWSKERAGIHAKKGPLYKDMMSAVNEANKITKPIYSGFVWKQGGADGKIKANAEDYYETLKQLIADLREDLKNPKLPAIILGRASDEEIKKASAPPANRKHLFTVFKAQNRAARDIPHTTTPHHGKLPTVADGIHFNTEGQTTLGKMAATAMKEYYK